MYPPFEVTPVVLEAVARIGTLIGRIEGLGAPLRLPQPQLRRRNRIRTIHGSLAIEGNTLSVEQVTDVLDDKRVLGPARDILEVKNAVAAYDDLWRYKPHAQPSLLRAHATLMKGLAADAGRYRAGNVGIFRGKNVSHVAPKAARVPELMAQLFAFIKNDKHTHAWIKACAFHYELEFIHPFSDGNGRMGRLWQHVLLAHAHPVFEFVPAESTIQRKQKQYYAALEVSDSAGNCTAFIEFSLQALAEALAELVSALRPTAYTTQHRLAAARAHFAGKRFSRKDYLALFKTISTATASRDLRAGVADGTLERHGKQARAEYELKKP